MLLTKIPFKVKIRHHCLDPEASCLGGVVCRHRRMKHVWEASKSKDELLSLKCPNSSFRKQPLLLTFPISENNPPRCFIAKWQCFYFHFHASYFSRYTNDCYRASFVVDSFKTCPHIHRGMLPVANLSLCFYCLSCTGSMGIARAKIKDNNKRSIVLLHNLPLWNVCAAISLSGHHEMLKLTVCILEWIMSLLLWLILKFSVNNSLVVSS